jgi:hypothetical protein
MDLISKRKHTPIVSEKQRGLFGAEIARKKKGLKGRTGMSEETLAEHLHEAAGKELPPVAKCDTPGRKIRSKGKGRGLAHGQGEGPIGIPIHEKLNDYIERKSLSLRLDDVIEKAAKLGSGARFEALKSKLSGKKGVYNPAGLAAHIGRKKWGKEKMAELSAKGKKKK